MKCYLFFSVVILFVVQWPTTVSTTQSTLTSPVPEVTTTSKYLIVNNRTYVELKNPCQLMKAMCPLFCDMKNITYNGRICETCYCSKIFGKRSNSSPTRYTNSGFPMIKRERKLLVSSRQNNLRLKFHDRYSYRLSSKLFDSSLHNQKSPLHDSSYHNLQSNSHESSNNNHLSQHPDKTDHNLHSSSASPTVWPNRVLDLFCLPDNEYCPKYCHVITVTVDKWQCHTCHCPKGLTLSAMVRPCNMKHQWCLSNCTVKQDTGLIFPCDYCDCSNDDNPNDVPRQTRFLLDQPGRLNVSTNTDCLSYPGDCPAHCHLVSVHGVDWKCHVCICNQVIIPKSFVYIHHYPTNEPTTMSTTNTEVTNRELNMHITATHTKPNFPRLETPKQTNFQFETSRSPPVATEQITHSVSTTSLPNRTTRNFKRTIKTTQTIPTSSKIGEATISTTEPSTLNSDKISCFICNFTSCEDTDLQLCEHGRYCMNTFVDSVNGERRITRNCVSKETCNNKWWMATADDSRCVNLQKNEKNKLKEDLECNFCCTENGCNKNLFIDEYLFVG